MILPLFRYGFVAVLLIATVATFSQASVLQLVPVSEVGEAQDLGVSQDSAAWVGEAGTAGECFSGSGAVLEEDAVEMDESDVPKEVVVYNASLPMVTAATSSEEAEVLYGDANRNGFVDSSDLAILEDNWQSQVKGDADDGWMSGDFNGDGKVDGSDVTLMACNWHRSLPQTSPVPEPSALVLLVCGAVGVLVSRRWFRRS